MHRKHVGGTSSDKDKDWVGQLAKYHDIYQSSRYTFFLDSYYFILLDIDTTIIYDGIV